MAEFVQYKELKVPQGNDIDVTFTIKVKQTDGVTFSPVNLTGAGVTVKVKTAKTGGSDVATYTVGSGVAIHADPTTGKLTVSFAKTDATATGGTKYYRVDVTLSGKTRTYVAGPFIVEDF